LGNSTIAQGRDGLKGLDGDILEVNYSRHFPVDDAQKGLDGGVHAKQTEPKVAPSGCERPEGLGRDGVHAKQTEPKVAPSVL